MIIHEEKITQFHTDGYFILDSVIPDEHLELLRQNCEAAIVQKNAAMDELGTDVMGITHRNQRYFLGKAAQGFPELRQFLFSELMGDICQAVLGGTVYFKSDQFVVKYGMSSMEFSWHQDSGYSQKRLGDHPEILTFWCPLDDVDEGNGTIYVLPMQRFGKKEVVDHVKMEGTNDLVGYFGDDPGEPIIAAAGSLVVFSSLTFHRSGANSSGRQRRIYTPQYTAEPMPGNDPSDTNELFLQDGVRRVVVEQ